MKPMFTIGADPEFFLSRFGKHVSAIGMIGGSKDQPRPLEREGFGILEDNVAVEFNIAPAHNHQEFIDNIQYVMRELRNTLPPDMEFNKDASAIFDKEQLLDPKAQEFGCEPDFNAWTRAVNPRPCAADAALRSAGGHIHIGVEGVDKYQLIRAMDVFAGVPSLKLDNSPEAARRRQLYGKAGACRLKPYGAEYRTLSNFWIFSPKLIQWAYDATARAVAFVKAGNVIDDEAGKIIQAAINDGDKDAYAHVSATYQLG